MGVVYRADDRLTGQTVALKRVIIPRQSDETQPSASQNMRIALSNEFRTLASLHHPNIITVLDYGFDTDRQPFFTMNWLENPRSIVEDTQEKSLPEKVQVILELLQALNYVHRRGIIHRDLKPGNILLTSEGEVKVLDFGLATVTDAADEVQSGMVGTLAYMAPELFMEEPASVASDLYAVGVIACELFQGRRPFESHTASILITEILSSLPDVIGLDEDVSPVVEKLLEKQPPARYASVSDVIQAFAQNTGVTIPVESTAVRESFLQAAQFVGREAELKQLTMALNSVVKPGQDDTPNVIGSAWLIGGESGVGKSRLLEEMRIQALVSGALVLHGQSVAEGGLPYQLWREPVRRLLLASEVSDTDAAILKEIVPDVDELLERPVPEVPLVEGKAGQRRLLATMTSLFRQQTAPMLLLLEDLQWADEGLEAFKTLISIALELPILMIATYRDDERPGLPEELPGVQVLKLNRLSTEGVSQLSASMLGDLGTQPHIVDFLHRETEGNTFFLVEVVRALAEEAGSLSNIAQMTLPQKVFAGGVQRIVQRRLDHTPPEVRAFLKLVAVAGRELDLKTLQTALYAQGKDNQTLEDWLTICANAAILEIYDGNWRFAHAKLREGVLQDLSEDEQRVFHREVAQAIEKTYPDDKAQAVILASHWRAASNPDKEKHYLNMALDISRQINMYQDTIDYAQRLLDLLHEDDLLEKVRLEIILATTYARLQRYNEAQNLFEKSLDMSRREDSHLYIAQALHGIGNMKREQGQLAEAMDYFQQSLTVSQDLNEPQLLGKIHLDTGSVYLIQGQYDDATQYYDKALSLLTEVDPYTAAGTLMNWGIVHDRQGKISAALSNYEKALETFRALGDRYGQGITLANIGLAYRKLGRFEAARDYFVQYQTIAREIGSPLQEAIAFINLAENACDRGEFAEAHQYIAKNLLLREQYGDNYYTASNLGNLGLVYLLQGDHEAAQKSLAEGIEMADKTQNGLSMVQNRCYMAEIHLLNGRFQEASQILDDAVALGQDNSTVWHIQGITLARMGNHDEARQKMQRVLGEADQELSHTPDLWPTKYGRAHTLATIALLSIGDERNNYLEQAQAAYHDAYAQAAARGVVAEQLMLLELITPLDDDGILRPVKVLLLA